MIERTHPNLIPVSDDLIIRRYMDILKFEKLLFEKSLFFCRVDKFNDPFEGAIPKKEVENRIHALKKAGLVHGKEKSDEEAQRGADQIGNIHKQNRKKIIANCWMGTPHESEAMWNLYAGKNGVAIQSKMHKLISSLSKNVLLFRKNLLFDFR